ncbi:small acid-soluble spore protein P [Aureibacillus halotolerans]
MKASNKKEANSQKPLSGSKKVKQANHTKANQGEGS